MAHVSSLVFAAVVVSACSQRAPAEGRPDGGHESSADPGVLATVNGVPITEADLVLKVRPGRFPTGEESAEPATPALTPAQRREALESLIRDEIEAQSAVRLGLDQDPGYRAELARRQAAVDAFRRQRLIALARRHEQQQTKVSEAEVRRYFDQNKRNLETEVHVMQILMRGRDRIDAAHRDIAAGTPFEEVAARPFPPVEDGARPPWDLGYLRYNQLPEQWLGAIDHLEEGQVSDVIPGPRDRFWIVKLVKRRRNPDVTFEAFRDNITETLRAERLHERQGHRDEDLRKNAKIRYFDAQAPDRPSQH